MWRPLKRALAVASLLALVASSAAGWVLAFHLVSDDHHDGGSSHHKGVVGLDRVLHGHAHGDGTPPHEHPLLTSVAAPIPGKVLLLLMGSTIGDTPERVATATSGCRLVLTTGPTHDPPLRFHDAFFVLRI